MTKREIMARIRIIGHIGILSFPEFIKRKAQAYTPGDPSALSPVEDIAIRNIFTPEQQQILQNPPSPEALKEVIDKFPEIMNEAVNQINMLPPERQLQGEYLLNSLLQYFDEIKYLHEVLQESAQIAPEDEISFLEPEFEKEEEPWLWNEPQPEHGTTPESIEELREPVNKLETILNDLYGVVKNVSSDDIAYSPNVIKNNFLNSVNEFISQLNSLVPVIETAFDAYA
jgi:hypothetical protein